MYRRELKPVKLLWTLNVAIRDLFFSFEFSVRIITDVFKETVAEPSWYHIFVKSINLVWKILPSKDKLNVDKEACSKKVG